MVIHDMRNPTNSIEYGVKQVLQTIKSVIKAEDKRKMTFADMLHKNLETSVSEIER